MRRGLEIRIAGPDGVIRRGTVIDWGEKGCKLHVQDDIKGDRIECVPYDRIRHEGPRWFVPGSPEIRKSVRPADIRLGSVVTIRGAKTDEISGPVVQVGVDEVTFVDQLGRYRTVTFSAIHGVAG
jgi:hypothetical protein